ncbi:MAG: cation transporter [Cyclobacteriaceae bacterium]|jgi:cation transport ATPase|nr:cation transporter [Cyclobacteriaceae bacterium]
MQASVFKVEKMDCPSEEQLIRLKLSGRKGVRKLHFDIHARTVLIYHDYEIDSISAALNQLQLNSTLISSTAIADLPVDQNENNQRKTLWIVLGINFLLFLIEITTGLVSNSMGLVADSLDMLADAIVY